MEARPRPICHFPHQRIFHRVEIDEIQMPVQIRLDQDWKSVNSDGREKRFRLRSRSAGIQSERFVIQKTRLDARVIMQRAGKVRSKCELTLRTCHFIQNPPILGQSLLGESVPKLVGAFYASTCGGSHEKFRRHISGFAGT